MMEKGKDFFVDLLNILPINIDCFIQAPSLDDLIIEKMLVDSKYAYYKLLQMDSKKKEIFINHQIETSFGMYIQSIEIKEKEYLLFEGYDGVEFGIISNKVHIPDWFLKLYVPEICSISPNW